jgi:hypothetical protein
MICLHNDPNGGFGYFRFNDTVDNFFSPAGFDLRLPRGTGTHYFGARRDGTLSFDGTLDDSVVHLGAPFTETNFDDVYSAWVAGEAPDGVTITLRGYLAYTDSTVPLRLLGGTAISGTSIPLTLTAPDPAHFTAAACAFGVQVVLDGVDISARVTGPVRISHEENASGLCTVEISPTTGALDLADYERKPITIDFVGIGTDGSELYTRRRFTGTTSTATHDPDTGVLTIEGTTDLQGFFEALDRDTIANLLPGSRWSEHIFDERADGWQYALDRLSTIAAECHLDEWGRFVLVPWARKSAADITYTDSERFDGSLRLDRVALRDLLTRVTINMDFRYARLRHREIGVMLVEGLPFCTWLDGWGTLPSKDMIRSAADSTEWTRTSDIYFKELPPAGSYCSPLRGWNGDAEEFCLSASWKASRRWAQTVTEQYAITVHCPDLEEAVGEIPIEEDYGLEAVYDATDYEQDRAFTGEPTGSVLSGTTSDWELAADEVETAGRTELEAAEECAIEKGKIEILRRARLNRVSFSPVYRPDVSLNQTVEVDTPYLECTGKVAAISEVIDPASGTLEQTIEVALSRHGGSGLAATTPTAPADQPELPAETPTSRQYYLQYRIGGTAGVPADNDAWDGFITNVQPFRRVIGANLYQTRFVLRMPEIEEAARDAIEVPAAASFEIEVPQDPLTIGA